MAFLLDTHTLIWMIEGNPALSAKVRDILDDQDEEKYVSAVCFWELAIKVGIKKLKTIRDIHTLPAEVIAVGFYLLPITERHALQVERLPHHHNDPFDRLLVAQAQIENLQLLSKDPNLPKYNVSVVW